MQEKNVKKVNYFL